MYVCMRFFVTNQEENKGKNEEIKKQTNKTRIKKIDHLSTPRDTYICIYMILEKQNRKRKRKEILFTLIMLRH